MNKKIIALIAISALNSLTYGAAAADKPFDLDEAVSTYYQQLFAHNEASSLDAQLETCREGIAVLEAKIEDLADSTYVQLLTSLYGGPPTLTADDFRATFTKLLSKRRRLLKKLEAQAASTPGTIKQDHIPSPAQNPHAARPALHSKIAALAAARAPQQKMPIEPPAASYGFRGRDDKTSESSSDTEVARVALRDLGRLEAGKAALFDNDNGGFCPVHGIIEKAAAAPFTTHVIHKEQLPNRKLRDFEKNVKKLSVELHKNPSVWLREINKNSTFNQDAKEHAHQIYLTFEQVKTGDKQKDAPIAKQLVQAAKFTWVCRTEAGDLETFFHQGNF